jgi:hypothetical protein
MTHYHKERDAFEEHQKRCTRNMPPETPPIKTITIGTEEEVEYFSEYELALPHWNMPLGTNPTTGKHYKGFEVTGCRVSSTSHDQLGVTWPTEDSTNSTTPNEPTTGEHYMNKYQRKLTSPIIRGVDGASVDIEVEVIIDVYDVLDAYPSGCPPIDHALKKLLCTGSRGAKDWETDLQEAIDSLERAKSFPPLPF